jgi:hypothetical protein
MLHPLSNTSGGKGSSITVIPMGRGGEMAVSITNEVWDSFNSFKQKLQHFALHFAKQA